MAVLHPSSSAVLDTGLVAIATAAYDGWTESSGKEEEENTSAV